MKFSPALVSLAVAATASARHFTVVNKCSYTVWPGLFTDLNAGTAVPAQTTGWEQAAGASVEFDVPDNWTAGRIWGRTECDFSTNPGPNSCATGGCNGGLVCDTHTGTGVPPASVAEWTLGTNGAPDYYDVSLVDGSNIPISVVPSASSCGTASCPVDLNPNCPAELQAKDASGTVVGCKSACLVDTNQGDSPNCCSGSHNTAATCPNSGVTDYSYFKSNCPNAYAYAYDESSGTALWPCDSGLASDYTLTFCP